MKEPEIPSNEKERVEALRKYSILDTLPEKEYDEITYLASQICDTPISVISLLDDERQWFKSRVGLEVSQTAREIALCAHAINNPNQIFEVEDTTLDERFVDNPLVIENPNVIFYAGIPLVDNEGYALGTLCVIDNKPNKLTKLQSDTLKILSNQVLKLFELRKNRCELEKKMYEVEMKNKALEAFAHTTAHDIKSPLINMLSMTENFRTEYSSCLDTEAIDLLDCVGNSVRKLNGMIDSTLEYSRNTHLLSKEKTEVDLVDLIKSTFALVKQNKNTTCVISSLDQQVKFFTNEVALERILLNLFDNSIKYCDKQTTEVHITIDDTNDQELVLYIKDNGPGIEKGDRQRVFEISTNQTNSKQISTGIGLASVKALIEGLDGTIRIIDTEENEGLGFELRFPK
ncbi:MAG: GAF domain-containing sensor histidine kinase [Cytophagales bacterium]|nr:GAF domain-containing sensor histidine kinase [Cytophagales bacterium]